ncbi:MAG: HAD-IIB family hydrolase [Methylotenera sp.]|nr:HAD-IIB family hydrolase [Methylotenera sp.]MDI1309861.1 HAD-IIB family hydrolase [Methylotenera sp.]
MYILMISMHGLIRGNNLELGKDADTGGQTTYVVELTKHLVRNKNVEKVDLLTRLIEDDDVCLDYSEAEEDLGHGARIIRLSCGPKRYLRKELLWPHLNQIVDKCLHYLKQQNRLPNLIHSHYADAGYVGQQLSLLLGIPQIHTGHSLGISKRQRLLASGRKIHTIEKQFNLQHRIAVEEDVIQHASLIITSTRQEIDEQYKQYTNFHQARFSVIPPGINTSKFSPPSRKKITSESQQHVDKYLDDPEKPLILNICRAELRKNISGLIAAYGSNSKLQEMANLLIIAGPRENIRALEDAQKKVMTDLLLDIDLYDLWGKVAVPKSIAQDCIPEIYRLVAKRKGVLINSAFTEPFGLTLIEAAASGLPIAAPDDGGPRDIVGNCRNGVLVNTLNQCEIASTLIYMLEDSSRWRQWAKNGLTGVKRYYSWDSHVKKYIKEIQGVLNRDKKKIRRQYVINANIENVSPNLTRVKAALISDIDNTLLGDKSALIQLENWIAERKGKLAFGVATGRTISSTIDILKRNQLPIPDLMITSVGTEIYYGSNQLRDEGWSTHIKHLWRRDAIAEALAQFPGMKLQPANTQREFKLSYFAKPDAFPSIAELYSYLHTLKLHCNLVYSHDELLDVLPVRASKGHAIRYLAYKWDLPLDKFIVAGDSGNDIEMLAGDTLAIVVGNHSPELEVLKNQARIYFAEKSYAAGILEGIANYHNELQPALN